MREILFRGKTPIQDEHFDDGEWVEGFYTRFNGKEHRIYSGYAETDCGDYYPDWFNVRPETVGQYTGLTDKNGKRIFEWDIIRTLAPCSIDKYIEGAVMFGEYSTSYQSSNVGYYVNWSLNKNLAVYCKINDIEIIGNIHDNPELLEANDEKG